MDNEALQDLDEAFDTIWQNTDQIPSALNNWQAQLTALFTQDDLTNEQAIELQNLMAKWSRVLTENRALLVFHLEHLQEKLKSEDRALAGTPAPNKKFTRQ